MLTDFPLWQSGGGSYLWPECYRSSDGVNYDTYFWGGGQWDWIPPSFTGGHVYRIKAINPNALYDMKITWNAFGGGVTGPTASTTIAPGAFAIFQCSDVDPGGIDLTTTGNVYLVIGGIDVPIAGDGEVEGYYNNGL